MKIVGKSKDTNIPSDQASGRLDPSIAFPLESWPTTRPTARALRLKKRLLENERVIDVERARYATQSYQRTEGQPMVLRRAHMLLHLARSLTITIHPDEVIVGNRSLLPRMGVIAPDQNWAGR